MTSDEFGEPIYDGSVNSDGDPGALKLAEPWAWWVLGGEKNVRLDLKLTFANGQRATIPAWGKFTMLRPRVTRVVPRYQPFGGVVSTLGQLRLLSNAMWFEVYISSTYPGQFGITQTIKYFYWTMIPPFVPVWSSSHGQFWLDKQEYYELPTPVELAAGFYPTDVEYPNYTRLVDAPGLQGVIIGVSCEASFHDFVRFTPEGSNSIAITLARVDWCWNSVAEQNVDLSWHMTGDAVTGPGLVEDDAFPEWEEVKTDLITWEE